MPCHSSLQMFLSRMIGLATIPPSIRSVVPVMYDAPWLARKTTPVLVHSHDTYETSTALITDCVSHAQGEGDMPADLDPVELARALLAAQQGIVYMSRTGMDTATLTATARSLAAQLLPARSGD